MNKILLMPFALLFFFACSTNQKNNEKQAVSKQDSANKQIQSQMDKIADELAPPDSDYTGEFFQKYENGVVKVKGYFRFGKRHGQWYYFYPNGLMWSEAFYDNGKMNGQSKVFYENGKTYYQGAYKKDIPVGLWLYNDTTGAANLEVTYDSLGKIIQQKNIPIKKQ
ncbi:MAG: hypothetical protein JST67_07100 [Bacteroidetes bacterium]|nr:hypothetical protein [Bacteroidota bacterium]